MASYTNTDANSASFEQKTYDLSTNGRLFDLPAGEVRLAGREWRSEELQSIRTINNATGNVVGGAEGIQPLVSVR